MKTKWSEENENTGKQLVVFFTSAKEDLTEHISGFLCCTSCVPEGKHVGQKDDTRENSCVTESKRKIGRKKEDGRQSVTLHKKRKATHIDILVSIFCLIEILACVRACPSSTRFGNKVRLTCALVRSLKFARVERKHDESECSVGLKGDEYRIVQCCSPNRTRFLWS